MNMIDQFTVMLSDITKYKTTKSFFKGLYYAARALWTRHKIVKYYVKKDYLLPNDVYNCIFMINHSTDNTIDFLQAAFMTTVSSDGASFQYYTTAHDGDIYLRIHKIPRKKEFSRIDVDFISSSAMEHITVESLQKERYGAVTLTTVLEIALRRMFTGD